MTEEIPSFEPQSSIVEEETPMPSSMPSTMPSSAVEEVPPTSVPEEVPVSPSEEQEPLPQDKIGGKKRRRTIRKRSKLNI
jgi:hypothetical protein